MLSKTFHTLWYFTLCCKKQKNPHKNPCLIFLYEYAIRLEMKDAFFGCHESYFRTGVFGVFAGLLGFEKRMDAINKEQRINKEGVVEARQKCAFLIFLIFLAEFFGRFLRFFREK